MKLDGDVVYWVDNPDEPSALLAIGAGIKRQYVGWFDTVRDRLFRIEAVEEHDDHVTVRTADRGTFQFWPLTLELYEHHVRQKVAGAPSFSTTSELQAYYLDFPR